MATEPPHVPGLELARLFYVEVVGPLLLGRFPELPYAAALIGEGSEVLGFDTTMSMDHYWGPRVQVFLAEGDVGQAPAIRTMLHESLPSSFRGFPVVVSSDGLPTRHRVDVSTFRGYVRDYLGFDLNDPITAADWLTFPSQKLRGLVAGAVFHDAIGFEEARGRFSYYPDDVWLYLLAAGWNRIGQEEHLVGRAGYVGDELGATIIASRLVRDLMALCFLMERRYAPYPKWFGTAFQELACASELTPLLMAVHRSQGWQERDLALASAYEYVARKQHSLGLCAPRPGKAALFFERPFHVIELHAQYAVALREQVRDPEVVALLERRLIGGIDQFSDNTDLLCGTAWQGTLRELYRP